MKKAISKRTIKIKKEKPVKEVEVEVEADEPEIEVEPKEKVNEDKNKAETEAKNEAKKDKDKRILEPLQPGQKYFEAPDGTIIIGEADKQQIWYRGGNDGKGAYINPKR